MRKILPFIVVAFSLALTPHHLFAQKKKRVNLLAIPEVTRDKVICFALYTVHDGTLKLTAQFYPLKEGESRQAHLEVKRNGNWQPVAQANIIETGWTAPFRVENWDDGQRVPYRVRHGKEAIYEGVVQQNPVDKTEFVIVGFTGNSIHPGHGGIFPERTLLITLKASSQTSCFFQETRSMTIAVITPPG